MSAGGTRIIFMNDTSAIENLPKKHNLIINVKSTDNL